MADRDGRASDRERLLGLASPWESRAIQAAVEIELFEALKAGPRTARETAEAVGGSARGVEILLRALVALGWIERREGRYALAEEARPYLVRGSPQYLGHLLLVYRDTWEDWGRLPEAVLSGRPLRRGFFYERDPERARRLLLGLHELDREEAPSLVRRLDLRGRSRVLDLGGGAGTHAIEFCRAFPDLRCVLFDLPPSLRVAEEVVGGSEVAERIELRGGDFFNDDLGGPYDAVFASGIVHGLGEEENRALLGRVFETLAPGGFVYLKDWFLDPSGAGPRFAALLSVQMLFRSEKGRCYPVGEVLGWLVETGFADAAEVEPLSLVRAVRAG